MRDSIVSTRKVHFSAVEVITCCVSPSTTEIAGQAVHLILLRSYLRHDPHVHAMPV